ncbi:hypothetical protein [Dickeya dadantii]|uniref:hypothetical protein n=1 Tax=Dickeya dadantii TaxID=204038 RepID=UPI0021D9E14D|nr:hypothetical protein [Dickeya dadantii]
MTRNDAAESLTGFRHESARGAFTLLIDIAASIDIEVGKAGLIPSPCRQITTGHFCIVVSDNQKKRLAACKMPKNVVVAYKYAG